MQPSPEITDLLSPPPVPQSSCRLFLLPPELRYAIYKLALADFPDPNPDVQYPASTYYYRPGYSAPRKSCTTLLRTCRLIFRECWYMPFPLREQIHYLAFPDRIPPGHEYAAVLAEVAELTPPGTEMNDGSNPTVHKGLAQTLRAINRQQGQKVEIESLMLFSQVCALESDDIARFMSLVYLHPKKVTIAIRHQDWWNWENDTRLYLRGDFLLRLGSVLSPSVLEFVLELESVVRKKDQVLQIAAQMREKWSIKRSQGDILVADATGQSDRSSSWTGNSFWEGIRWVRDETSPRSIEYYVHRVTFRPAQVIKRMGGKVSPEALNMAGVELDEAHKKQLDLFPAETMRLEGTPAIPVDANGNLLPNSRVQHMWGLRDFVEDDDEDIRTRGGAEVSEEGKQGRRNNPKLFGQMSFREIETVCDHATAAEYEASWHQTNPEMADKEAPLSWWYEKRFEQRGY